MLRREGLSFGISLKARKFFILLKIFELPIYKNVDVTKEYNENRSDSDVVQPQENFKKLPGRIYLH